MESNDIFELVKNKGIRQLMEYLLEKDTNIKERDEIPEELKRHGDTSNLIPIKIDKNTTVYKKKK